MSFRQFVALSLVSGIMVGCGDSASEKENSKTVTTPKPVVIASPSVDMQKVTGEVSTKLETKAVEVKKVVASKITEAKAVAESKITEVKAVAETKVADVKTQIADKVDLISAKATDYKALITKYTQMDMSTVKAQLAKFDASTLKGLGLKITEVVKEESAKILKLTESIKGLSFTDLGKATDLKNQITALTGSTEKLTTLYNEVMTQIKTFGSK